MAPHRLFCLWGPPALADCAGVQGHVCFFGCVRCWVALTTWVTRFLPENHPSLELKVEDPRMRDPNGHLLQGGGARLYVLRPQIFRR